MMAFARNRPKIVPAWHGFGTGRTRTGRKEERPFFPVWGFWDPYHNPLTRGFGTRYGGAAQVRKR
jgi:hypothetical protein